MYRALEKKNACIYDFAEIWFLNVLCVVQIVY